MKRLPLLAGVVLTLSMLSPGAWAETVMVKYRGPVDTSHFQCESVSRSSFINRVCYEASNQYMLIALKGTYYHYCGIDSGTVGSLMTASSMGQYFNGNIKGRFDCRTGYVPNY
jgi:hypothetical protein